MVLQGRGLLKDGGEDFLGGFWEGLGTVVVFEVAVAHDG